MQGRIEVWACGWRNAQGKECVQVYDTKVEAERHQRSLQDAGWTDTDIWEMTKKGDKV